MYATLGELNWNTSQLSNMINIVNSIKKIRARLPFVDSLGNPVIYISGSGRSGTTWVAELVSEIRHDRLMFEPFRPGVVPSLSLLNNRQYLDPDYTSAESLIDISRIIDGTLRDSWVDRYNNKFVYKGRVVKEIRTNLLLGWLLNNFERIRVIHIIRDPISTIKSQLNGGWKLELEKFSAQKQLIDQLPKGHLRLFSEADSVFKKALLHWAVENYIPVMQFRSNRWDRSRYQIFSYEKIKSDQSELGRLMSFCDIEHNQIPAKLISKPSRVSRGKTTFNTAEVASSLSETELEYAMNVVEIFGLSEWCDLRVQSQDGK